MGCIAMKAPAALAVLAASLGIEASAQDAPPGVAPAPVERTRLLSYPGSPFDGLKSAGIDIKGSLALTYGGLVSGDGAKDWRDGGRADIWIGLDGEKLGLWDGFSVSIHPELVFGRSTNRTGAGLLVPTNTLLAFPRLGKHDAEVSWVFNQTFSDEFSLSFGKFNMLDIAAQTPLVGGGGLETFMNTSIAAPIDGVTPPYVFGAVSTWKTAPAIYSLMIYDPRSAQDWDVISDPFADGVSYSLSATIPTKLAGRTTFVTLRGVYSSANGLDLDSVPDLLLPGQAAGILRKDGYRYASVSFQHYLAEDPSLPGNGWGLFGDFGISDGNPNPIGWHAVLGVGGTGTARDPHDRWGVAYFRNGISDDLVSGLSTLGIGLQDEYGIEAYYNAALTPWLRLSADVQWVRPANPGMDEAVVLGLRLQTQF